MKNLKLSDNDQIAEILAEIVELLWDSKKISLDLSRIFLHVQIPDTIGSISSLISH